MWVILKTLNLCLITDKFDKKNKVNFYLERFMVIIIKNNMKNILI